MQPLLLLLLLPLLPPRLSRASSPPPPPPPPPPHTGQLSVARTNGVGVSVEPDLLVFAGGYTDARGRDKSRRVDVYNASSDAWTAFDMSQGRTLFAGASLGSLAMFGCGETGADVHSSETDTVDVWNASAAAAGGGSAAWSVARLSQARKKCSAAAVVLSRYKSRYNTRDGARRSHGARTGYPGPVREGKLLFAGGWPKNGHAPSAVVDIYDYRTATWSVAKLSQARMYMSAASVGTLAIFAGGLAPGGDVGTVDIYDAATGLWRVGAPLPRPIREGTAIGTRHWALFYGGNHVSMYHPQNDTWKQRNTSASWAKMASAVIGERFAVFAGGIGCPGNDCDTIEVFDDEHERWFLPKIRLAVKRQYLMGAGVGSVAAFAGGSNDSKVSVSTTDFVTVEDLQFMSKVSQEHQHQHKHHQQHRQQHQHRHQLNHHYPEERALSPFPALHFACNASGNENATQLKQDARYNTVIFEFRHSWKVQPYDHEEDVLAKQAGALYSAHQKSAFVYRNHDLGSMFAHQRDVLRNADPSWFTGPPSHDPHYNISWRALNFTNPEASHFFLKSVAGEAAKEGPGTRGVFWDEVDAPLCVNETSAGAALWKGTVATFRKSCALLAQHGKQCMLSIVNAISSLPASVGPFPACVRPEEALAEELEGVAWIRYYEHWLNGFTSGPPNRDPKICAAMITNAAWETSRGIPISARAPGSKSKYRTDLDLAAGAFLVSAGPGSSFGYSDCWFDECVAWQSEFYDRRIGQPVSAPTGTHEVGGLFMRWTRKWEGVDVELDCETQRVSFSWK